MIKVLDKNTIEKIAAGEVIERPLNVVKELVENSIDANATNIYIEIKNGGIDLIKVVDDGDGFEKDDLKLAFKRYATSKITNIDDMYKLNTFGFRGEALASISIVSDITIKTKQKNNKEAYKISCSFGIENEIETVAKNDGTEIVIIDLFKNLPVRKKALDNINRETSKILDIIEKEALSNPNIGFRFVVDGKEKICIKGTGKLSDVILDIYGREVYNNILPVDDIYNGIKIYGYVGKPSIMRSNKNDEIYYANNRYIKSKIIEQAIEDAYKTFLMQHKYPIVVLMVELKENMLDVNVHPRKTEVLFNDDNDMYNAIYETVRKALNEKELIYETKNKIFTIEKKNDNAIEMDLQKELKKTTFDTSVDLSKMYENNISFAEFIKKANTIEDNIQENKKREEEYIDKRLIKKDITTDYRIIGQVLDTYIIIEYNEEVYFIDQHAAHEKINFERLKYELEKKIDNNLESEMLIVPIMVSLTKNQERVLKENSEMLKKIGFNIEYFGNNDYKIYGVPMILSKIDKKNLFMEIIREIEEDYKNAKIVNIDILLNIIASMACKMSIKANEKLTIYDMKNLIDKLFAIENPYNCPHGRPTTIKLTKDELEKKFKRIV